jgi:hypothetical protein
LVRDSFPEALVNRCIVLAEIVIVAVLSGCNERETASAAPSPTPSAPAGSAADAPIQASPSRLWSKADSKVLFDEFKVEAL